MRYEIENANQPYVIEAPTVAVAMVACLFLGDGHYSLKPLDPGDEPVPRFLMGDADQWCQQKLGKSFNDVITEVTDRQMADLIACLDTCLMRKPTNADSIRSSFGWMAEASRWTSYRACDLPGAGWRAEWLHGGAVLDIGSVARQMAEQLRAGLALVKGRRYMKA